MGRFANRQEIELIVNVGAAIRNWWLIATLKRSFDQKEHAVAEHKIFRLPDLGEGLPDAEIVEWAVAVGEKVILDGPLVSMETAKAVVDVPAPCSGILIKIFGKTGDVIETGHALAEFELSDGPQRAEGHETDHTHAPAKATEVAATPAPQAAIVDDAEDIAADAGSVVGSVTIGSQLQQEATLNSGGVKAVPAVRAMAKKLGVNLARIKPSGDLDIITMADVKRAAEAQASSGDASEAIPVASVTPTRPAATPTQTDTAEPLRGMRRTMARTMAQAHAQVVPTTLMEDANLAAWGPDQDLTARLVRALVAAARAEPALNAWFDGGNATRTLHSGVHIGIAIDSDDGLFVANLRDAQLRDSASVRAEVSRLRTQVLARALNPAELSGYTIMLSNFGVYAGRYATPIVAPPCVAILGAGRARIAAVPVLGSIAAQRILPLSLTFDHRACTGGEAARFLAAILADLAKAR